MKGRLLLLLRFSSASVFPAVVPPSLLSFVGVVPPVVTSAWKNLCRADCVFWAEAVQDLEGGLGPRGSTGALIGASSTEEGRRAGSVPPLLLRRPGETEEEPLQLLWVQTNVPGWFPGL